MLQEPGPGLSLPFLRAFGLHKRLPPHRKPARKAPLHSTILLSRSQQRERNAHRTDMLSPPRSVFAIAALAHSWKAKALELEKTDMAWRRIAMVLRCHLSTLDPMVRMSRVDWCLPQTTSLVPISRQVRRLQPQDAEQAVPAKTSTLP